MKSKMLKVRFMVNTAYKHPRKEEDKHDYSDMNAKDLYALCKQKGIEVEAKRSKEYYLEKLA